MAAHRLCQQQRRRARLMQRTLLLSASAISHGAPSCTCIMLLEKAMAGLTDMGRPHILPASLVKIRGGVFMSTAICTRMQFARRQQHANVTRHEEQHPTVWFAVMTVRLCRTAQRFGSVKTHQRQAAGQRVARKRQQPQLRQRRRRRPAIRQRPCQVVRRQVPAVRQAGTSINSSRTSPQNRQQAGQSLAGRAARLSADSSWGALHLPVCDVLLVTSRAWVQTTTRPGDWQMGSMTARQHMRYVTWHICDANTCPSTGQIPQLRLPGEGSSVR